MIGFGLFLAQGELANSKGKLGNIASHSRKFQKNCNNILFD